MEFEKFGYLDYNNGQMATLENSTAILQQTPVEVIDGFFNAMFGEIEYPAAQRTYSQTPVNADTVCRNLQADFENLVEWRQHRLRGVPYFRKVLVGGGEISAREYEGNHFDINSLARDILGFHHFIVANTDEDRRRLSDLEDSSSLQTTSEINSLFPRDGLYAAFESEQTVGLIPAVEHEASHAREGTYYYPAYVENRLKSLRLFHRGHRNSLHVGTVTTEILLEEMAKRITESEQPFEIGKPPTVDTITRRHLKKQISKLNLVLAGENAGIGLRIGRTNSGEHIIYGALREETLPTLAQMLEGNPNLTFATGLNYPYIECERGFLDLVPGKEWIPHIVYTEPDLTVFAINHSDQANACRELLKVLVS